MLADPSWDMDPTQKRKDHDHHDNDNVRQVALKSCSVSSASHILSIFCNGTTDWCLTGAALDRFP